MNDTKSKAKHYRERAEQIRKIAEGSGSDLDRKILLAVARDFEQMAKEAEN